MNPPPKWKHDQEMNFEGARTHLKLLAGALQTAIDAEKLRLSHMYGVRDSYKK